MGIAYLKKQVRYFDVSLSFKPPLFCLYNGCISFVRTYIGKLVLVVKPFLSVVATEDGRDDESETCIAFMFPASLSRCP